jgi:uncharacterized protein (TIGR02246 family)
MLKKSFITTSPVVALLVATLAVCAAHASSASSRQTTSTKASSASPSTQKIIPVEQESPTPTPPRTRATPRPPASPADPAQAKAVRAVFDSLVDGIRRADADAVMKLFWNSQQLLLFNNNGTVTKSWEQARSNRESLYARVKDVKLDVRDVRVKTLGPTAAMVTCLWDQSQIADGQSEHTTGRMTLIFQKIGTEWKIIHVHTSPERPDPSLLSPSERATENAPPKTEETIAKPPAKTEETPAKPPEKTEETRPRTTKPPAKP